jgi:hypothetical protein
MDGRLERPSESRREGRRLEGLTGYAMMCLLERKCVWETMEREKGGEWKVRADEADILCRRSDRRHI